MSDDIRVTIKGARISFDRIVTETTALQLLTMLMGGTGAAAGGTASVSGTSSTVARTNSAQGIRTFLDHHEAKDLSKKITAIAAYLADQGTDKFTSEDILKGFTQAREKAPGNPSRDISNATRPGWIATVRGERGTYFITQKGLDAVARNFAPAPGARRKARRAPKKTKKQ